MQCIPHIYEVSWHYDQHFLVGDVQHLCVFYVSLLVDSKLIDVWINFLLKCVILHELQVSLSRSWQLERVNECCTKSLLIFTAVNLQREWCSWFFELVCWSRLEDSLILISVLEQEVAVGVVVGDEGGYSRVGLHLVVTIIIMNNFQEDEYHIWRIKLDLAKEGNPQALEQLRAQFIPHLDADHPLVNANYSQLLKESNIHLLKKEGTLGPFEVYSKVPTLLLLQGKAIIQCVNTEGDNDVVGSAEKAGLLQVSETELKVKYGDSNVSLITQFEVVAQQKSILIEFSPKSIMTAITRTTAEITLREEVIMRKYMLIALKHITKLTYAKGTAITHKFYLLDGRACIYSKKMNCMLACYEEGFFDSAQLQDPNNPLYIFEGAYLMLLEEEMLKDEVVMGLQAKREEHLKNLQNRYDKMTSDERQKTQEQLIQKFALNRKEVEKEILGIEEKPLEKTVKSKNDFIRTSSSIKDKCGIRIRKAKKTN